MGIADIHIHTLYSWDSACSVSGVLKKSIEAGLDVIAITDHDAIAGALEAEQQGPRFGVQVIPGIEISTAEGHLLALDVRRLIPAGASLIDTLLAVGEQGGLAVAAHPMATGLGMKGCSLSYASIHRAAKHPLAGKYLAGVETFNAGLVNPHTNLWAGRIARNLNLPQTGSSDAHVLDMIGWGATVFPGQTGADFLAALRLGLTEVVRRGQFNWARLVAHWLPGFVLRQAGWVAWTPEPGLPLRLKYWRSPYPAGMASQSATGD
jgi:predicted metal-dependent phosphoesterase TrpH